MKNGPSVSVVIPIYNCSVETLTQAVQSVRQQTWPASEIVLVDDGSSDPRPAEIVAKNFPGTTLIRHPENLGGADARNTGINHASGEMIAFLDADDLWLQQKLDTQLGALAEHWTQDGEQPAFSASNCLLQLGSNQKPCNAITPDSQQPLWRYFLLDNCALQTSTLIVPAKLARKVLFRSGLKRHQDWDFVIRLQQEGALLVYLEECLSVYRLEDNPQRISRNPRAPRNSVIWFRQMVGLIPRPAMQRFFFSHLVTRRALSAPFSLLIALCGIIALSPLTAIPSIALALRKNTSS